MHHAAATAAAVALLLNTHTGDGAACQHQSHVICPGINSAAHVDLTRHLYTHNP